MKTLTDIQLNEIFHGSNADYTTSLRAVQDAILKLNEQAEKPESWRKIITGEQMNFPMVALNFNNGAMRAFEKVEHFPDQDSKWTHWRPINLPPLPKPEPDACEVAFKAAYPLLDGALYEVEFYAFKAGFKAAQAHAKGEKL